MGIYGQYADVYGNPIVNPRNLTVNDPILSDKSYPKVDWDAIVYSLTNNNINFYQSASWIDSSIPLYNGTSYNNITSSSPSDYAKTYRIPVYFNRFTDSWSELNEPDTAINQSNGDQSNSIFVAPNTGNYDIGINNRLVIGITSYGAPSTPAFFGYFAANKITSEGYVLKVFGLLEKSEDDGRTWKLERIGELQQFGNSSPSSTGIKIGKNTIRIDGNNEGGNFFYGVNLNATGINNISLNQGDRLRYNLYIVDPQSIFRFCDNWEITINDQYYIQNITQYPINYTNKYETFNNYINNAIPQSVTFAGIYNTSNTQFKYLTDTSIESGIDVFYVSSGSNIINAISPLYDVLNTSSIFIPSTSSLTTQYYTPVLDNLSVQPGDLIRFGGFESSNTPIYYTVMEVSSSSVVPFVPITGINQTAGTFTFSNAINYRQFINPSDLTLPLYSSGVIIDFQNAGDITTLVGFINANISNPVGVKMQFYRTPSFNVPSSTNSLNNNLIFRYRPYRIRQNPNQTNQYIMYFTTDVIPEIVTGAFRFQRQTETTIPSIALITDRNINTNNTNIQADFAILRPKPDETSVIINFKKKEGEVSQTILIPQDANDLIKSKVGDIFKNFNTDLQSNTTA